MKNEKNYDDVGFCIPKIWQILKHFSRSFHQAFKHKPLISEECIRKYVRMHKFLKPAIMNLTFLSELYKAQPNF